MSSRSVNKVMLLGFLGRDAETSFTANGTAVTKFSMATTHRYKDTASGEWKENTNWANVVMWRNEKLGTYLTKGKQVYVEGRLQSSSYDDKDGKKIYKTDVIAEEVILLGAGSQEEGAPMRSAPRSAAGFGAPAQAGQQHQEIADDEVPF